MSVVTGLRSCRISLTVRRETPSKRASLSCVNPAAGRTSSRRISPGCIGRLFRLFSIVHLQRNENQLSSSTVLDQFQCADSVNAFKHAELSRQANKVVSLIPESEPFISGIEHHRANARLPRYFINPRLSVHQHQLAIAPTLKFSIDAQLPEKDYRDGALDAGAVVGYFFLFHLSH